MVIGGYWMIYCKLEAVFRIRIKVKNRIRIRMGDDLLPVRTSVSNLHHMDADPDPAFHFDADPDPTFYIEADPYTDPSFQIKAQNFEKCSNRLIFHQFWLVICI
jgi:hypothetical protein